MLVSVAGASIGHAKELATETIPKGQPLVVPTFHCLGIYWSPENGAADKKVLIKFRESGQEAWRDGLPMRHNPVKTKECKGDYRGSLVNLKPGTGYEIELTLEGTDIRAAFKAATWSEQFPVASTVKCESSDSTLMVNQSGKADGYVLYDGTGATIDTGNKSDVGIDVKASYVILRGFTIRNVKQHGIELSGGQHIVIEDCDISKWGSEEDGGFGKNHESGVNSRRKDLCALVIQRCKIHHPSWDTNSWAETRIKNGKSTNHPLGPQAISFIESEGNHVIRYNELWSDDDHYYNDVIGGHMNGSYRGSPGADSDIYCNYIASCWDDGIEAEGGDQNVRIWNNYIENVMVPIGNAACSIGPLYVWRNVSGRSYSPPGSEWGLTHGNFLKMGYADPVSWMTGHTYVFNNTIFQPNGEGAGGLGGKSRDIKHTVTRNNILHVRASDENSIATKRNVDVDFDYDLCSARCPNEKHGISGTPKYAPGAGFSFETKKGSFELAPDSPGYDKGVVIPNFCDVFSGDGPDMGAHEAGAGPLTYGVKAKFIPPGAPQAAVAVGAATSKDAPRPSAVTPVDPAPHREALVKALQSDAARKGSRVWVGGLGKAQEVLFKGADAENLKIEVQGNALPLRWKELSNEDCVQLGLNVCGDSGEAVFHAGALAVVEKLDALAEKAALRLIELKSEKAKDLEVLRGR